jgi:pilus assembly protein CpaB
VIAILPTSGTTGDQRSASVLLQRILVLAVGLDTASEQLQDRPEGQSRSQREMLLTLSLNLQEAQLLALAIEKGKLGVALRNPDDQRIVEGIPDMSSTALTDTKARAEVQNLRKGPVRLKGAGEKP